MSHLARSDFRRRKWKVSNQNKVLHIQVASWQILQDMLQDTKVWATPTKKNLLRSFRSEFALFFILCSHFLPFSASEMAATANERSVMLDDQVNRPPRIFHFSGYFVTYLHGVSLQGPQLKQKKTTHFLQSILQKNTKIRSSVSLE